MKQPNPVELYEQSVRHTRKAFAGVKPNQMSDPTPCEKWNVKALMEHITGGMGMLINGFSEGVSTEEDHDAAKGGTTIDAFDKASKRALVHMKKPGVMEKQIKTPIGEMPGAQFTYILFNDMLVHGWDLAKATKQDTKLPANLVEADYAAMSPRFTDLQKGGYFKGGVQAPPTADTQAKLLAGMGRKA